MQFSLHLQNSVHETSNVRHAQFLVHALQLHVMKYSFGINTNDLLANKTSPILFHPYRVGSIIISLPIKRFVDKRTT
mgnify:CR=1 FL=1